MGAGAAQEQVKRIGRADCLPTFAGRLVGPRECVR
jgi:hypothetical protein